jgi:hypothetical protein
MCPCAHVTPCLQGGKAADEVDGSAGGASGEGHRDHDLVAQSQLLLEKNSELGNRVRSVSRKRMWNGAWVLVEASAGCALKSASRAKRFAQRIERSQRTRAGRTRLGCGTPARCHCAARRAYRGGRALLSR